ncbi:MAG: hypothetical protein ACOZBZ_03650 [Patescibacteria group bacterium]
MAKKDSKKIDKDIEDKRIKLSLALLALYAAVIFSLPTVDDNWFLELLETMSYVGFYLSFLFFFLYIMFMAAKYQLENKRWFFVLIDLVYPVDEGRINKLYIYGVSFVFHGVFYGMFLFAINKISGFLKPLCVWNKFICIPLYVIAFLIVYYFMLEILPKKFSKSNKKQERKTS